MSEGLPHISVCICTYKRPRMLKRCLETVCAQQTNGSFDFSIVVVDNDSAETARAIVEAFALHSRIPVKYCFETCQNIAMARNKAVGNARGEFIAFIDDDEAASSQWLQRLLGTINEYEADGVLGPVDPSYEEGTPQWIISGGFYDRPIHPTGMQLNWRQCRTGNVLLKRDLFAENTEPFDPKCLSGEDQDFFRRMIAQGRRFIWCHEAPAYETVPASRWKRSFLIRRALFRGIFAQRNHGVQPLRLLQAMLSLPVYVLMLPFALILGQARFMSCVFKLSYHTGRLLAVCGINPIRQPYVCE